MWAITSLVLFATGYVASIFSWPAIKAWANGVIAVAGRIRGRLGSLKARVKDI